MAIDVTAKSLDEVCVEGTARDDDIEVIYDEVLPEGDYIAKLARVYPWRKIVKDTKVNRRDENGKYVYDENGQRVKDDVKDLEWYMADIVLVVDSGEHASKAIKGVLSTHPNGIGQLRSFLYCSGLFGVVARDINKHLGAVTGVKTRNVENKWQDKETGLERSRTEAQVYYFIKPSEVEGEEDFGV
jgi:hypothetical protein